jgi:DNA-binding transcriptional ArsR family regulator
MKKKTLIALAEPNRLHIVELLRRGPRPVGEIAHRLHLHQPQASKHLRVLRDAAIVEVKPVAQRRIYSLQAKPFKELDAWIESYRRVWDGRFDRLDAVLDEFKEKEKKHGRRK